MTLFEAIDAYITLKRSLGAVFSSDARILRSFAVLSVTSLFATSIPRRPVSSVAAKGRRRDGGNAKTRRCAGSSLGSSIVDTSRPVHFQRIGPASRVLSSPTSTPAMNCSAFSTQRRFCKTGASLYAIRPSKPCCWFCTVRGFVQAKACGCAVAMWTLRERVLTISDSKFFKSRLVPIGAALTDALSAYSRERRHLPMPAGTHSALLRFAHGQTRLPLTA